MKLKRNCDSECNERNEEPTRSIRKYAVISNTFSHHEKSTVMSSIYHSFVNESVTWRQVDGQNQQGRRRVREGHVAKWAPIWQTRSGRLENWHHAHAFE